MRLGNLYAGSLLLETGSSLQTTGLFPARPGHSTEQFLNQPTEIIASVAQGPQCSEYSHISLTYKQMSLWSPETAVFHGEPEVKPRQVLTEYFQPSSLPSSSSSHSLDSPDAWREEIAGRHPASAICASSPHQVGKHSKQMSLNARLIHSSSPQDFTRERPPGLALSTAGGRADE